jgi:hypothetical protein
MAMDGKPGLGGNGFDLEVILSARPRDSWMLSDKPEIALPINECIAESPAGIPAVPPAIVMFLRPPLMKESKDIRGLAMRRTSSRCAGACQMAGVSGCAMPSPRGSLHMPGCRACLSDGRC